MFVEDDNRLRIRTVDVLRADAEYAYLRGGAMPGDRISLTAIESPINGMKVRTGDEPDEGPGEKTTKQLASDSARN
jgi:hypothetical protein